MADFKTILMPDEGFGQISVERCIAEIRAGRPVLVTCGRAPRDRLTVEALGARSAAGLEEIAEGRALLLLPAPRLRRLGLDRSEAGAIALPHIDLARISALAFNVEARIDAPVAPLSDLGQAALELVRLALVLPALLLIEIEPGEAAGDGALSAPMPRPFSIIARRAPATCASSAARRCRSKARRRRNS